MGKGPQGATPAEWVATIRGATSKNKLQRSHPPTFLGAKKRLSAAGVQTHILPTFTPIVATRSKQS